jgi:hypothetical protein
VADSTQAKYDAIRALIAADTGTGGLSNTASTAYVRDVAREGTQQRTFSPGAPYIIIDPGNPADQSPLAASTFDVSTVNIHCFFDRDNDRDFSRESAVINRLRTRLANVTPTTSGTTPDQWAFTSIRWLRSFNAPASERTRHRVVQLTLGATRN